MVLTRLTAGLALLAVAGCGGSEYELSPEGMHLPATLLEGLPLANALALEWAEGAYLVRLGGGFTVMNDRGEARNQTYHYHARIGFSMRKLTVNVIGGMPWTRETTVQSLDPPFVDFESFVDSDAAVTQSIAWADSINAAYPDSIPVPAIFAARLASIKVWPEPVFPVQSDSVAWRVDFLEEDVYPPTGSLVYWSTARFYLHPRTEEKLGYVVPRSGREIYPRP